MRKVLILLTSLCPLVVSGAVYKWVDEEGNIVFTDQPRAGAEEVQLPELSTYSPPSPAASAGDAATQDGTEQGYSRLEIVRPKDDDTVRANDGNVPVELELDHELDLEAGHRIGVTVDGIRRPKTHAGLRFVLANIDRGTHTLHVSVVNENDRILITSNTVTLHLKRYSEIFEPDRPDLPPELAPTREGPVQQAPRAPMAPRGPRFEYYPKDHSSTSQ
jgi:hypothetical protein